MANPSGNHRRSEAYLYIDGAFVGGLGASVGVENPSDGTIYATVKGASVAQVESAIRAAWQARQNGSRTTRILSKIFLWLKRA